MNKKINHTPAPWVVLLQILRANDNDIPDICKAIVYRDIRDDTIKVLERLAALEAVCREIIENCPQHAVITDPANIQVAYSIAQKLKAVLEEA